MKCLLQSSAAVAVGLLTLCIALEAFPYAHICSDCLPDDDKCILRCSFQEQETDNPDSMLHAYAYRKRYQHQLRFGKRGPHGITGHANVLDEAFRPQLRFGKRSHWLSRRGFMSHMRFGKRDYQFDYKRFQPRGFGEIPDADMSALNTPRSDTGVLEIPAIFYGQRQEKRFRPQGRFGKRLNPNSEAIIEDNDLPLYTGNLRTTQKTGLPFNFDDMRDIEFQLQDD